MRDSEAQSNDKRGAVYDRRAIFWNFEEQVPPLAPSEEEAKLFCLLFFGKKENVPRKLP